MALLCVTSPWSQAARAVSVWTIAMVVEEGKVVSHTLVLRFVSHLSLSQPLCHA